MVFTRGVSSRMETTVAGCHADAFGTLITVVPLFPPRVTVAVVPVHFPEPRLVVVHEAQAPYPFGGLPEIEVRHKKARWPAMLGRERLAVVLPDDQRLSLQQVLHRQVARIPAIAERHRKSRRGFLESGRRQETIDGNAAPVRVELRPARHTVNVDRDVRR